MQIVIDISKYDYDEIKEYGLLESPTITEAIRKGIVLSTHGRLIDADVLEDTLYEETRFYDLCYPQLVDILNDEPTVLKSTESETN